MTYYPRHRDLIIPACDRSDPIELLISRSRSTRNKGRTTHVPRIPLQIAYQMTDRATPSTLLKIPSTSALDCLLRRFVIEGG